MEREELVIKARQKIKNDANNCIKKYLELIKLVKDEEYIKELINSIHCAYALIDYVTKYNAFEYKYFTGEYIVSEETLNILSEDNILSFFEYCILQKGAIYNIGEYLDDKFFEFDFITIAERILYQKKLKEEKDAAAAG